MDRVLEAVTVDALGPAPSISLVLHRHQLPPQALHLRYEGLDILNGPVGQLAIRIPVRGTPRLDGLQVKELRHRCNTRP